MQVTNKPTKKLTQATSSVAPQLTAELTSTRSAYVKANNPGEVSGSSVILGVKIDNGTSSGVDLGNVVVNLTQANGSPASSITSAPAKPLSGTLKSGATAAGTYVFVVPSSQRNPITVTVTLSADTKVAVFRGKVA